MCAPVTGYFGYIGINTGLRGILHGYEEIGTVTRTVKSTGGKSVMLEKDIVTGIIRYLKTEPYCFAWKTQGGMYGQAGIPDLVCCVCGRWSCQ